MTTGANKLLYLVALSIDDFSLANKSNDTVSYNESCTYEQERNAEGIELNLNDKQFSAIHSRAIAALIKTKSEKFKKIDLSDNFLGEGLPEVLSAISMKECTELCLKGNAIEDKGCEVLRNELKDIELSCLDLSFNRISSIGISDLCAFFHSSNLSIKGLNLNYNNITDLGCLTLAHTLKHSSLSSLGLSTNRIEDFGSICISQLIHNNHHLTNIDLSTNIIALDGMVRLTKVLQTNRTIQSLNVSYNAIGSLSSQFSTIEKRLLFSENIIVPKISPSYSSPSPSVSVEAEIPICAKKCGIVTTESKHEQRFYKSKADQRPQKQNSFLMKNTFHQLPQKQSPSFDLRQSFYKSFSFFSAISVDWIDSVRAHFVHSEANNNFMPFDIP